MSWAELLERDPGLVARLGDPELVPPAAEELLALVGEHVALPGEPLPVAAEQVLARWKPGVSTSSTWRLRFGDGGERLFAVKRYADGKAREIAAGAAVDDRGRVRGPFARSVSCRH